MTRLPLQSNDVLVSMVDHLAVAYDLDTETVHLLNHTAAALLAACDGETELDDLVADWSTDSNTDPAIMASDVTDGIAQLSALGLVGRVSVSEPLSPLPGTSVDTDGELGVVHAVLDDGVQFRSPRPHLLEAVDRFLALGDEGREATVLIDVFDDDLGRVHLHADSEWVLQSIPALLAELSTIVNKYAVRSHSCITMHAGAVRSHSGEVVLMPALSGAGKSTLTGALIAAGWDYLGDEAIGIRPDTLQVVAYAKPLALDLSSRVVLGLGTSEAPATLPTEIRPDVVLGHGESGALTRVVLPRFEEGAPAVVTRLEPPEAIVALLEHTLNLARIGEDGLDTLCAVATDVEVYSLVHGGIDSAVEAITAIVRGVGHEM